MRPSGRKDGQVTWGPSAGGGKLRGGYAPTRFRGGPGEREARLLVKERDDRAGRHGTAAPPGGPGRSSAGGPCDRWRRKRRTCARCL